MWKLSKYLQGCRLAYIIHCPWFSMETMRAFVRYQEIKFLPAFSTNIDYNSSLKVTVWISYVGNTSFVWEYIVSDYVTGAQLAKAFTQMVLVDVASRRPMKIPDEMRQRIVNARSPIIPQFPTKSANPYRFRLSVASSDTDYNQHTNQAVYVRMCMDAVSAGALKGQFSFPKEVAYYNPKSLTVNYVKESRMGETLEFACWEDGNKPLSICCEVSKGSEVICQCQMEFENGAAVTSKL